ncbi:LysR family transcriptional regulator [Methylobacterium brachythecii]|nr:LysR family transcriptional regulator [Methylobacterium brachythecii]
MNPTHVDLFRAVLRHGGMTRAAVALGIGQPHISRAIAQLEADIGFPLFLRGHGSARPTPEGEAFGHEVEQTYAGFDHLRHAARQIRERGTGTLRVACQPSLASRLLPRAIRRLNEELPTARVSIHVPSPDTIWSCASSGQCDIGLARPRTGYNDVEAEPFMTVKAVCAIPRKHPLARKRTLSVQDLAAEPMISGGAGVFQQSVEAIFAAAGVAPRFVFMAEYTAARCGLVAEGMGLAIVDPVPAREFSGAALTLRPFQPELPIETMLLRPAGRPVSQLAERLIGLLKQERDALG